MPDPRSSSHNRQPSVPSRPTTPLRRISTTSLRALSLSHSASRAPSSIEPPLAHLSSVFAELADAVSDLTANVQALDRVYDRLDGFNEAFAAWLLGLRANTYTLDFFEAPTKLNFDLHAERQDLRAAREQAEREAAFLAAQRDLSPPSSPSGTGDRTAMMADSTFVTNEDESFSERPPRGDEGRGMRGRGGAAAASARGRGRGGKGVAGAAGGGGMTKRRKEEMAAFADPVLPLLPITLRENRRLECEKVLWSLKERPNGISLGDLTKHLATAAQPVPQVRINEVLLALVRAKVASKVLLKGVNVYRLDPNKFPS
ncbi:hypothetical protein JCM5296_003408 [Sporobolomyces johnsonii]